MSDKGTPRDKLRLKRRIRSSKYDSILDAAFALGKDRFAEFSPPRGVSLVQFRDRLGAILRHKSKRDGISKRFSLRQTEQGKLAVIRIE